MWRLRFGVWGLEFGVEGRGWMVRGLVFGVWCLVFGVWGLRFDANGFEFRVLGSGFRSGFKFGFQGLGCRVQVSGLPENVHDHEINPEVGQHLELRRGLVVGLKIGVPLLGRAQLVPPENKW